MAPLLIVVAAIVLAGLRPKGTREWMWAVAGALLLLALRYESVEDAWQAIWAQWNVLLFIFGLMGLAAAAEEAGAFTLVAEYVVEHSRGSRRRLFVLLFLAGAALTILLSNDATAIAFTPIVYGAVGKRGLDALPFLFGCTFVADTASFGLPFANPANIIVLPRPHILDYIVHLAPAEVLAIAINLALFLVLFRAQLRGSFERDGARERHPAARRTLVAVCGVVLGYLVALAFDVPLGPVAFVGALIVLAVAHVSVKDAAGHVSWSTFLLIAAFFVLLDALDRAGLVAWVLRGLHAAAHYGPAADIGAAAVGAALLSNALNNLPVAVASAHVVSHSPHLAYALIAGIDVGPNLTTAGSLATILWVSALRKRDVHVSPLEYLRLGAITVPPMLAAILLWLWLVR